MRKYRSLTVGLAAATMLLLPIASASAQTVRVSDGANDAPQAFDIRWARYNNADPAVTYTATVAALRRNTAVGGYLAEVGDYDGYEFVAWRTATGTRHALNYIYGASGATRIRCADMTIRWQPDLDRAKVRIPRSCLPHVNGRLRMAATTANRADKWSSLDRAAERRLSQG